MKTFRPYEPKQSLLLPSDMQDWLSENHPARFVSDVVDETDLGRITKPYEKEERGYPPYHPVMLTGARRNRLNEVEGECVQAQGDKLWTDEVRWVECRRISLRRSE